MRSILINSIDRITIVLVILVSFSMTGFAQRTTSWTIEAAAGGYKILNGPEYSFGADVVKLYKTGQFEVGGGVGVTFLRALRYDYVGPDLEFSLDYPHNSIYSNEVILPLFLRAKRDVGELFFASLDAGYSFNLHNKTNEVLIGTKALPLFYEDNDGTFKTCGFFFEPQIGLKVGRCVFLGLGAMLQNSKYIKSGEKYKEENHVIRYSERKETLVPSLRIHIGVAL